ncbi:MAG: tRNA pseudouridine(13) synthase TruD [candidate division SR1 bacterium]|nr:tRNA pseudouridine(13) synthase TruD [candidate division SR1 bacterium]
MLFSFKQKSQDFIVEEELPFKLRGKGDALFVYFEKRNLTTMDIITFLCQKFNISRLTLGIAGLKDKDAVTRQRISIYKTALAKLGGEHAFLNALAEKAKIIKTDRHDNPIGMSSDIINTFFIRLRATKKLSLTERKDTDRIITELFATGVPNVFGNQRFGIEERNRKMGKDILDGKLKIHEKFEAKFKLQAYASRLFNEYVYERTHDEPTLLDGDILRSDYHDKFGAHKKPYTYNKKDNTLQEIKVKDTGKNAMRYPKPVGEAMPYTEDINAQATGPVIGYNLLTPTASSEAGQQETKFLESHGINKAKLEAFQAHKIFGIRRKIWMQPLKTKHHFDGDDLVIKFSLGAGEYASVLIDSLLKQLG